MNALEEKAFENEKEANWLEIVRPRALRIRFGSEQILVHDGRVTQIDRTERTRFAAGQGNPESHGERQP